MSSFLDETKIYNQYALDIINDRIISCKKIKQACQRYLSWFDRDDLYFDYEDVDRKIRFTSHLKHWEGSSAGKQFILLPWQQWVYAGIFGFKYKSNNCRVIDKVLCFCARKNGKSSLCGAIALTCTLCDNERGGQIGLFANSAQQAQIMFNMTSKYARSIDPNKKIFQRYRSEIRIPYNDSKIFCRSSDVESADGANYSCFIMDEVHMQKDSKLYDVLRSSQQSRTQPLSIMITTAGTLLTGYFLYDTVKYCNQVLDRIIDDDHYFIALYTLDENDDWKDENVWIKANPSLNETVIKEKLAIEVQSAINNPALEPGVKTKNMNMWVQSSNIWISDKFLFRVMENIDLSQLKKEKCYMGVDLSSVSDLSAWSIMFPPNKYRKYHPDKFIFKSWIYIPQDAVENSVNKELYKRWIKYKEAFITSGDVIDYDYILKDIIDVSKDFYVIGIYTDPHQAKSFINTARTEGLPMEEFGQTLFNFNSPTKNFEILLKSQKLIIDKSSLIVWSMNNVELKADWNNNVKPMKAGRVDSKKIDPIITMIQAYGGYEKKTNYVPQIYAL